MWYVCFPGYDDVLGLDPDTWAWDIPSRELLHAHTVIGDFAKDVDVPKTVTMTLDLEEARLTFDIGTAKCSIDLDGMLVKIRCILPSWKRKLIINNQYKDGGSPGRK